MRFSLFVTTALRAAGAVAGLGAGLGIGLVPAEEANGQKRCAIQLDGLAKTVIASSEFI